MLVPSGVNGSPCTIGRVTTPSDAGRHVELMFAEDGTVLEVDADESDLDDVAPTLVAALGADDPREAERMIADRTGDGVEVRRRNG